jgi:hypothetical protein
LVRDVLPCIEIIASYCYAIISGAGLAGKSNGLLSLEAFAREPSEPLNNTNYLRESLTGKWALPRKAGQ